MKEFKITKEQILELASKDESCKEILKEAFPEVFKTRIDTERMPYADEKDPEISLINDTTRRRLIWVSKSKESFILSIKYQWKIVTAKDGFQRLIFE